MKKFKTRSKKKKLKPKVRKNRKQVKPLKKMLKEIKKKNPTLDILTISSMEGLSIVNKLSLKLKLRFKNPINIINAMSAAIFSVGTRSIEEITNGQLKRITIEGDKGRVIIDIAGNNALLTIFSRPDKNHIIEKQGNLISLSSLDGEHGKIFLQEFKVKQKVLFAMVAALFSLGGHSIYYMKRSGLKMVYMEGDKGNVIITPNNDKTLIETYIQN